MVLQYFWFIFSSAQVILCFASDHKVDTAEATDLTFKRMQNRLIVNMKLKGELISLKLHKTKTSIPSTVPVYVSENGIVEQYIPNPNEEQSSEAFTDSKREAMFTLHNGKLLHGVFRKDDHEYVIKYTLDDPTERRFRHKRNTNKVNPRKGKHVILRTDTKPGAFPLPDFVDSSQVKRNGKKQFKYSRTAKDKSQILTQQTTYVPPTVKVVKRDYYVELFLVLDNTVYEAWYNISKEKTKSQKRKDALESVRFYFTHVVQGMDERYQNIVEDDFSVKVRLAGFFISTKPSDCPWITNHIESEDCVFADNCTWTYVNAYSALDEFRDWLFETRRQLPRFDHAILYTRINLAGVYSTTYKRRISGTTEIKGVCTYKESSIIEDVGLYGTTQTSTHELAHNLGAYHDGDGNNCSKVSQYIMASDPGLLSDSILNNPFEFSNCSIEAFRIWFNRLNEEGGNCLINRAEHVELRKFRENLQTLPGYIYDPDEQCKYLFGNVSYNCKVTRTSGLNICNELFCFMPDLPGQKGCFTTHELRANPGTYCDDKSVCKRGRCVYDSKALSLEEHCEQNGEFQGLWQNNQTCSQLIRSAHRRCYSTPFKVDCCKTCAELRTPMYKGCEYGDHKSWCGRTKRSQCYSERTRRDCCETCRFFETDVPGCKHGDRASWCANISVSECYVNADTCCQTCSHLRRLNLDCPFGDRSLDCWSKPLRDCYYLGSHCCDTCPLRKSKTMPDCPYGDRKDCILFNCLNPGNWKDCCFTCSPQNGYIHGVTQVNITEVDREYYRNISEEAAAAAKTGKPSTITTTTIPTSTIPTTTIRPINYGNPWGRVTQRKRRRYRLRTRPSRPVTRPVTATAINTLETTTTTTLEPTTSTSTPVTSQRILFGRITVRYSPFRPYRRQTGRRRTTITPTTEPTTFLTSTETISVAASSTPETFGGCRKKDEEDWCYRARARDCYSNSKTCCYTCPRLKRDEPNCEYGDRVSWCEQYVSSYRDCIYDSMEHTCCLTCASLRDKPYKPQQRQQPATQQPRKMEDTDSECNERVDEFWCSSLHSSYCYEIQVRELCCNACEHYKKTVSGFGRAKTGCEWGDKQTWCDTMTEKDCQYRESKQTCCDRCS